MSRGGVYNGVSYLVNVANTSGGAAPSSPGVMVVNNIKQINTSGAVVATPQVIKQVLVNTDVEIMLGDSSYGQAVSSLIITNISGAEVTGSVKIRTTVAMAIAAWMESARCSLAWRRHLHLIIRRHRKSTVRVGTHEQP